MDRVRHHFTTLRSKYAQFFLFLQQAVTAVGRQCEVELAREQAQIRDLVHQHSNLQVQSILSGAQTDLPFGAIIQSFCSLLKATIASQGQFKPPIDQLTLNGFSSQNRPTSTPFQSFMGTDRKQAVSAYTSIQQKQIGPKINSPLHESPIVNWRMQTPVQKDCSFESGMERGRSKDKEFMKVESQYRHTPPKEASPNKFDHKIYKEASQCLRRYENSRRGFSNLSSKKVDPLSRPRFVPLAFPLNK